jgi:hypothetical protein
LKQEGDKIDKVFLQQKQTSWGDFRRYIARHRRRTNKTGISAELAEKHPPLVLLKRGQIGRNLETTLKLFKL